jgi:hypothetical protein
MSVFCESVYVWTNTSNSSIQKLWSKNAQFPESDKLTTISFLCEQQVHESVLNTHTQKIVCLEMLRKIASFYSYMQYAFHIESYYYYC